MPKRTITIEVEQKVADWLCESGVDPSELAEQILRQHLDRLDAQNAKRSALTDNR